jgi:hypothetical protein
MGNRAIATTVVDRNTAKITVKGGEARGGRGISIGEFGSIRGGGRGVAVAADLGRLAQ